MYKGKRRTVTETVKCSTKHTKPCSMYRTIGVSDDGVRERSVEAGNVRGGALAKSRPRALKEGSRQQRSQRSHVGGSIAHGKEISALSSVILGKSLRISF